MRGERVLLTGATGQIGFPLARRLAEHNEVWGVARFRDPADRARVDAAGIRPVACDVASGDLAAVPRDVSVVVHLAAYMRPGDDYDEALRHNAEGTGLLLEHCRAARAALVMSTQSVYRPHDDPAHVYTETDPLGDAHYTGAATYSVSKIGQEAVARFCSRAFGLPVTIARMNASYGPGGGLPAFHADAVRDGRTVAPRWDPCPYSPIHDDDIAAQVGPLLDAASTPATIVNWGGDQVVTVQEWCAYMGELLGVQPRVETTPVPGTLRGSIADSTRRAEITGPCSVGWKDGVRAMVEARAEG